VPVLPALALAAAYGIVSWLEMGQGCIHKGLVSVTAVVLAIMAIFNTPFFENYGANARNGWAIMETLPLKVLLGQESRDIYLSRHVRNYPVVQYLNHLPGRKKALFWWNDIIHSMFYLEAEPAWQYSPFGTQLFGQDPNHLHRVLRENGVTSSNRRRPY
jgi:hypothetical protein